MRKAFRPYKLRTEQKYKNRKTSADGKVFDSKKEAKRFEFLKALEHNGIIANLETQKKFVLVPTQREPDTIGPRGGKIPGKIIEREVSYLADFVYTVVEDGRQVVEDTKGFRTPEYVIKRKLMLYVHGIKITEI